MSHFAVRSAVAVRGTRHITVAATTHHACAALLIGAVALTLLLSLAATPRRTGDAHQYIAMATQFSKLQPPSLSPGAETAFAHWFVSQPAVSGFPDGSRAIRQPALVRNGSQEFSHFWLYSLLAAPVLRLTSEVGAHPITAFTAINALLLGAAVWVTGRVFGTLTALAIVTSPVIWFVARAQVEVFSLSFLCLAVAATASSRWGWASIAAAIASTQNLPIAATLPLFWAGGVTEWFLVRRSMSLSLALSAREMWTALGFAFAGVCIVSAHPAYYLLRLGVITPQQLNGGIAGDLPSLNQLLAPIVDPDIGILAWLPAQAVLAIAGIVLAARAPRLKKEDTLRGLLPLACTAITAVWFLFVFAQTTNFNSGGTVHVSRYALWLIPLTLPAIAVATHKLEARWPLIALVAAAGLFVAYLGTFRPDQPEKYVVHSPQAIWLMSHVPALYHPLPEIFVERTLHIDGGPRASAADPDCHLIFIVESQPTQSCALTAQERSSASQLFAEHAQAVWIRRTDASSAVSLAIARR